MFWPGLKDDIIQKRAMCQSCNYNAPSNPTQPPFPVNHPQFPFSDICADFFEFNQKSFLVVVDRYSNWISLFSLEGDNSANVIKVLRTYFMTWGVPITLSTDGAQVFTSKEMITIYFCSHK